MFFPNISRATKKDWISTTYEVLVITILSILPLIGAAVWSYFHQKVGLDDKGHIDFSHFLSDNIVRGQLAFYAISNWAAVIWLCGQEFRNALAARALILVLCAAGYFYCGMLISPEPFTKGAEYPIAASSLIVYVLSIVSYFVVTIFEKIPPPTVEDSNNAGAASLKEKLRERRRHE